VQKELEARKNELTKLQHQVLQQHETNRGHMEKIKELKEIQLDPARRGQVEELKQS
jgi:peptide methionine sulfoxide reductase MsrB